MSEFPPRPAPNALLPFERTAAERVIKSNEWRTERIIHRPASEVAFTHAERDLNEPDEARTIRMTTWMGKLEERAEILRSLHQDIAYLIAEDAEGENATNLPALFEVENGEKRRLMYAGTTITRAQAEIIEKDNTLSIPVYPMNYSEWIAAYNPEYAEAFKRAESQLPYAGIGVSVLMETRDGRIPLTIRGEKTPVYPGRLYSPGGGPTPDQTPTESLIEEIGEEIGLRPKEHFDLEKMIMLALVSDTNFAGSGHSRPELVAYLPLNVSFAEVEQIRGEKAQKQPDVWGITSMAGSLDGLILGLSANTQPLCPPTEAGLVNLIYYKARKGGKEFGLPIIRKFINKYMN